jgi:hypothetical protein
MEHHHAPIIVNKPQNIFRDSNALAIIEQYITTNLYYREGFVLSAFFVWSGHGHIPK